MASPIFLCVRPAFRRPEIVNGIFMTTIIGVPMFCVNRNSDVYIGENKKMSIGQRIRDARKAAAMTQGQLAAKVGMRQNSISELENGDSAGTTNLAKFAQALRVNALWLETGVGDRTSAEFQSTASEQDRSVDAITTKIDAMKALGLISVREATLLRKYRMASPDGQEKIDDMSNLAERDELFIVHDQAKL